MIAEALDTRRLDLDTVYDLTPGTSHIVGRLFSVELSAIAPQFAEFCA